MSPGAAIVVGGASGLGAAIVRALHGAGHPVTIADRDRDAAERLAAASLAMELIRNRMLNGTSVRLDGALRMPFAARREAA
jgi:NAD(P)-dependent dehydrogenase (short-subunit alcohol dehydrogenase family)